ncbi:MAG: hypothetical protein MK110_12630 [Fuerstiella sp.]|nr:hypothetical protein [Fuerstiella sp.]
MISESEMRRKRAVVALLAVVCIVTGVILLTNSDSDGLASAFLRVGLLLGAFWLVLPAKDRPAAWARVSPWSVGCVVGLALILPRARFFIPVLVAGVAIGWLVRPRNKKGR